jgi:hypothetical protein
MRYLSNPSFAVAHVIMFANDSSVILIPAPLRNQYNYKEIKMNIKAIESNDVEYPQYHGDVVYMNYDTGDYDHYNSSLLTSQDLIRLKAHYQKLEDREFNPDPNYSIQDEYYDNLADEFADEFAN